MQMSDLIVKPAKKVVVCKPVTAQQTKSGLHLNGGEHKPELGEVYVIGAGTPPIKLEKGDTIVYRRYTDNKILVAGVEFNFIDFKDIMAVVPQRKEVSAK